MEYHKFKASFVVPSEDLKGWEFKELPVRSTIPLSGKIQDDPEFKVSIPDFMFNELADTEPKFKTTWDQNNREYSGFFSKRDLIRKFKKTQSSTQISSLQDYFQELTKIINERHSLEKATMKKKIFIKFSHSKNKHTNGSNNAYRGETVAQSFNYFIGYEVMTEKHSSLNHHPSFNPKKKYITKIGYASPMATVQHYNTNGEEREDLFLDLLSHNQTMESFEHEFSIVDWTQEREDFCEKIMETFTNVNKELSEFLKDIDSDKMDSLMSSMKFLAPNRMIKNK